MRYLITILLIIFPVISLAATSSAPAYRTVSLQSAFPASSGFSISFEPDEALCKQKYGKRWQENCAIALGMPGREEKNISMSPNVPGVWRWEYGNLLSFTPAKSDTISPDTLYTISLEKLRMPASVQLNALSPSFRTLPKSVQLISNEFLIDPSSASEHRLAGSVSFNYPETGPLPEPELFIGGKPYAGKPELVWNSEHNRLAFSWLIKNLPSAPSQAKILFPGYGYLEEKNGQINYFPATGQGAVFSQSLPASSNLLKVKNARIQQQPDANLDNHFTLDIDFSLYVSPDNAEKALTIWELPLHNSPAATSPYNWDQAPAISASILKASTRLEPRLLDKSSQPKSRFSFTIPSSQGRYLLVRMDKDLCSASGQNLGQPWFSILQVPQTTPQLGFLQSGNILPRSGRNSIDIYSSDMEKIAWKVEKIRDPFLALLTMASAQPFSDSLDYANVDIGSLSIVYEGEIKLAPQAEGKAQFSTIAMENPVDHSVFSGPLRLSLVGYKNGQPAAWANRLIVPTDLSIMAKKNADGSLDCFIFELAEGAPAKNVKTEILGANGLPLFSGFTDEKGHVQFSSINGLKREKQPVAIIASRSDDLAWLPLQDKSRIMETASFPVSGNHLHDKDLNVYAFGQRGIYRPGDAMHFGIITRTGDFSLLPSDLPLHAEIVDPRGIKVWKHPFTAGENGFSEIAWQTPETAPSGKYSLNIRSSENGDILFNCMPRIENFIPEAMKMKITPPNLKGWLTLEQPDAQEAEIALQNLYGTPAAGNRVKTTITVSPATFRFAGFEDYTFTDPAPLQTKGAAFSLQDIETNQDGIAKLALPREKIGNNSALLTLNGEGMEKDGGRVATATTSFMVSPIKKIAGSKMLGDLTNPNFIATGKDTRLELIALDNELRKSDWHGLQYEILRGEYVTALISDGSGGFRHDDILVRNPVQNGTISIPESGLVFSLPSNEPGEFVFLVRDETGKTVINFPYTIVGDELRKPGFNLAGSKMRLRLDKPSYNSGDTIQCSLDLPYDGHGLIAIEREGVRNFQWFKAKAGETIQKIAIPNDFEGKGYVSVAVARDVSSPDIYMSPASFSVMPFIANTAKRNKSLKLKTPQNILPGELLEVEVSASAPGNVIISAVDEGILLLDNFKKPDPVGQLLANRALDVQTLHINDLLMPDAGHIQSRISPFGGGMSGAAFGARFQNPFKRRNEPPVTFWSGIVQLTDEPVKVAIPIPDYYTGSLKIVAIGVDEAACGVQEKDVLVSAPVIANPHFPLAVSPGDIFEANVVLENTLSSPVSGTMEMEIPDSLTLLEQYQKITEIPANGRVVVPLRFKAGNEPGVCEMKLNFASSANNIARPISLSIRPPVSLRATVKTGVSQTSAIIPSGRKLYPFQSERLFSASPVPFPLMAAYAAYLDKYPYGCTEQLVSRAFGQILLPDELSSDKKADLLKSVAGALRERSNYGGVSLWNNSSPDLLLTAYSVDYLLTLREKGFFGNEDLLDMLCDALENSASLNEPDLNSARVVAYALWNLTRSGRITTRHLENLVSSLNELNVPDWEQDLTSLLISASKREMRMREQPNKKLVFNASGDLLDAFSQHALYITIMARYFPEDLKSDEKHEFFDAAMLNLNDHAYATFSSLQGLRALKALEQGSVTHTAILQLNCDDPVKTDWVNAMTISSPACEKFTLSNIPPDQPVFWMLQESGYDSSSEINAEAYGIHLEKQLIDSAGNPVQQLLPGDVAIVRITAFTEDGKDRDCVITDLLPGGCEMIFAKDGQDSQLLEEAQFIDRQEERMLIFAKLSGDPKIFEWKIRAMNAGDFIIPPALSEDMGNSGIYGNTASGRLKIASGAN